MSSVRLYLYLDPGNFSAIFAAVSKSIGSRVSIIGLLRSPGGKPAAVQLLPPTST